MSNTKENDNVISNDSAHPLYVRVPGKHHQYLEDIKDATGITKSDSVTLLLHLACKYIDSKKMLEMFDEYMLTGDIESSVNS